MKAKPHFKATVDAKALHAAAKRAADVVRLSTIPILGHAWLRMDGDELVITATDLSRGLSLRVPAQGVGETTIQAVSLAHFAAIVRSGQVEMELKGSMLFCRSGDLVHQLPAMLAEDFPRTCADVADGKLEWSIPSKDLKAALKICAGAVETGKLVSAYMHGVCFQYGSAPFFYAVDDRKLARITMPALAAETDGRFIVPTEALPYIEFLCDGAEALTVRFADNAAAVSFSNGPAALRTALIDAVPPAYENAIPKDNKISFVVDTAAAISAIAGATPAVTRDTSMSFAITPSGTGIDCVGRGDDGYVARDVFEIFEAKHCDGLKFGAQPAYLKWALESLDADRVTIATPDIGRAFTLTTDSREGVLLIVMPMHPRTADFAELEAARKDGGGMPAFLDRRQETKAA